MPFTPPRLVLVGSLAIAVLVVLLGLLRLAWFQPPSFDGGMNLNVARSLADGAGYGRFYDQFDLFPREVQTNAPFVFPAAAIFALFGVGIHTSEVVSMAYLLLMALAVYVTLRKLDRPEVALIGVFVALQVPGMIQFGSSGYGEIPALGYLFIGLPALGAALERDGRSSFALLGGAALALSFLTKTVALIWIVPAVAIFGALAVVRRLGFRPLVYACTGLVVPILAWELYRLFVLGSPDAYLAWWGPQVRAILFQAGVDHAPANTLEKGYRHARILANAMKAPLPVVLAQWVIPVPLVLIDIVSSWKRGRNARVLLVATIAAATWTYALWWLFVTPTSKAWLRRILDGLVLQEVLAVLALAAMARMLRSGPASDALLAPRSVRAGKAIIGILALILAAGPVAYLSSGTVLTARTIPNPVAASDIELAAAVSELPRDAHVFGYGWWQAPAMALLSGRRFYNLEWWTTAEVGKLAKKYLVLDHWAVESAPKILTDIRTLFSLVPLRASQLGAIYEIRAPADWQLDGLAPDALASSVALDREDYPFVRGLHQLEAPGWRWARPDVRVLLARKDQTAVFAEVTVPYGLLGFHPGTGDPSDVRKPVVLSLAAGECGSTTQLIPRPGDYRLELPLTCPPSRKPHPLEISLGLNSRLDPDRILPDLRLLSFRIHRVGLL